MKILTILAQREYFTIYSQFFLILQWCVEFRSRNNPHVTKDCIDAIASLVSKVHTVNLKNPELTIVIEIFKVTT
jgi:hypothetical protein